VVTGVIAANTVVAVWGVVDAAHHELAERIETAILVFFAVELVLRLCRYGWALLRQPWGVFDVAVILNGSRVMNRAIARWPH
jgi:hypothetical protein